MIKLISLLFLIASFANAAFIPLLQDTVINREDQCLQDVKIHFNFAQPSGANNGISLITYGFYSGSDSEFIDITIGKRTSEFSDPSYNWKKISSSLIDSVLICIKSGIQLERYVGPEYSVQVGWGQTGGLQDTTNHPGDEVLFFKNFFDARNQTSVIMQKNSFKAIHRITTQGRSGYYLLNGRTVSSEHTSIKNMIRFNRIIER